MTDRFISAVGGYIPSLRLDRKAAAAALRFSGLGGRKDGYRSVAGWDEDALTLAVESARNLATGMPIVSELTFASTSAYFLDRPQSAILVDALALPRQTRSSDVGPSRRCGTSALLRLLEGTGDGIVASGEKRETKPGSPQQAAFGDGGAAVRVGNEGSARYLGKTKGLANDLWMPYGSSPGTFAQLAGAYGARRSTAWSRSPSLAA